MKFPADLTEISNAFVRLLIPDYLTGIPAALYRQQQPFSLWISSVSLVSGQ